MLRIDSKSLHIFWQQIKGFSFIINAVRLLAENLITRLFESFVRDPSEWIVFWRFGRRWGMFLVSEVLITTPK